MKLINDWLQLLKDDNFQQDLVFLVYMTILLFFDVIPVDAFITIAVVIIGGDAVKKLGK